MIFFFRAYSRNCWVCGAEVIVFVVFVVVYCCFVVSGHGVVVP